jgi:uncharacterized membrane protein SpoIIM required for sporulation
MDAEELYQTHQHNWKKLSDLLSRSKKGINQLSPREVVELGQLYRAATSDLALAQRDFPRHRVTGYLNQLVRQAHAVIYRSEPLALNRIIRFITVGYPRVFRETLPFIGIATLLFILPAVLAALAVYAQPDASRWLLPMQMQELIPMIEQQELWTDIPINERPYTASFIMQNNIRVAFLAFGGGILVGLATIWVMLFNGLMLGALTGLTAHYGVGFDLWTFVIGHGVLELSVIMMAGGSGLMLGWAIVNPGLLRRRDALVIAAQKAVRLLIGSVPLLVVAGTIEGFISPNEFLPWPVKWGVGVGSGLLLYAYLLLAGRGENPVLRADSDLLTPGSD